MTELGPATSGPWDSRLKFPQSRRSPPWSFDDGRRSTLVSVHGGDSDTGSTRVHKRNPLTLLSSINIRGHPTRSVPTAVLICSARTAAAELAYSAARVIPELVGLWRF
jgi:hypothetical protein